MKLLTLVLMGCVIAGLCGCISSRKLQKEVPVSPDAVSATSFTGSYLNKDTLMRRSLWEVLHNCYTRRRDLTPQPDTGTVRLSLEAGRLLHVKLYHGDSLAGSFDLKAKLKGNYLFVKRRFLLIAVPFLFFNYREVVPILSEEGGMLNVQYADDHFIWVIFAGGVETRHLYRFPRTGPAAEKR